MRARKGKLVLDIGASDIKIIEVVQQHGGYNIVRFARLATPVNAFSEGAIAEPAHLAAFLEHGLKVNGFRAKNAIITATNSHILTREVVLPKTGLKDMERLVRMEAPNHFPIDLAKHSIDFKILEGLEENDVLQYRVLILVTPLNILEGYLALCEGCGLFLERIDYKGNSLVKLMKRYEQLLWPEPPATNAVLDIGAESAGITVSQKGILKFSRTLNFGSNEYNKELISLLGCEADVAEQIKRSKGALPPATEFGENKVEDAAAKAWVKMSTPFFEEVTRVFDFFTSRDKTNNIDRILLTGGGSLILNIAGYLQSTYGLAVMPLNCMDIVEVVPPVTNQNEFSAYYSGCVGAFFED